MDKRRFTGKQKKSKFPWIIIGIVTVVVIIAAVWGTIAYRNWQEEQEIQRRYEAAEETVNRYINSLQNQNMEEFTTFLIPEDLQNAGYSETELQERYDAIFSGIGASDFQVTLEEFAFNEDTETYPFSYTLSLDTSLGRTESLSYENSVHMIGEDEFLAEWNYSHIFPGMEEGDTVQISFEEGSRGNIYDRHGNLIAGDGSAWEAGMYPASLGEGEQLESNLTEIANVFDITVEYLQTLLDQSWVNEESFVPFGMREEGDTPQVAGVLYQQTVARIYPLREAAAHLTGYVGQVNAEELESNPTLQSGDIIGKAGLESQLDRRLRGTKGGRIAIVDEEGEEKNLLIESEIENGENIYLTIDMEIQNILYNQLDDDPGAAVVTEPSTGEIIALTSSPSYDPQLFTRGITTEQYNLYADDENSPFLARYSARYAPGSTFKILTAMIGLDEGVTTPDKVQVIEGMQWAPDEDGWGDHQITRANGTVTNVTLEDALVYSDNIYFAREGLEMGAEDYLSALSAFPFGASMDLPFSMSPAQISNSGEFENDILLADTAYGQGQILMSPIHQLVLYSPVVNQGELVFPKLLRDEEQEAESLFPITSESAEIVREGLIQVVENPNVNTHGLSNAPFSIGAKTGTAEIMGSEGENITNGFLYAFDAEDYNFTFVGFLEGQGSGDVVERFTPIMEDIKTRDQLETNNEEDFEDSESEE